MDGPALGTRPDRTSWWIAAIPLLLIPCNWLWWWAGGLNPGLETGRAADLLLLLGAGLAAWNLRSERAALPTATVPVLLAVAWLSISLLWSPVREPGFVWLVERAAAAASALALALLGRTTDPQRLCAAAAIAGAGVLACTCLTQYGELGLVLRTNREAPFGNANFAVGAALPLAALGFARFILDGAGRWWLYALATGACAGLLASGQLGGDPCRAVWLGGCAIVATALALRLPRAAHGPVILAGAACLIAGWLAGVLGLFDPSGLGAGSAQRVHLWRAAAEALTGPSVVTGHGIASVIAVLPEQPSFGAVWLTVPSYAAHAHAEPLQVLLDGGLVLAGLLGWALWATIRPLWLRRDEPAAAALLVAWSTAGTLCLVESHLSQPGGLLCLAVLAGLSWRVGGTELPPRAPRIARMALPALVALALAGLIARELADDGGGPVSIEARTHRRIEAAPTDRTAELAELDRLRARLGPLDNLDLLRAICLLRLHRVDEACAALASQLDRVPADADALALAAKLHAKGRASPDLRAAEARALARARTLLATVRENPTNGKQLRALGAILNPDRAAGDPAPDP